MATIELGTISHGTLRAQDLLSAFQAELKRLGLRNDPKHNQYVQSLIESYDDLAELTAEQEENAHEELEAMLEELDSVAPEGVYFGSHYGDGSDFGFWPIEEDSDDTI